MRLFGVEAFGKQCPKLSNVSSEGYQTRVLRQVERTGRES